MGDAELQGRPSSDELRTYLAGERTLLAWIRTALAMMGFGFLVARFGLLLRELTGIEQLERPASSGFSLTLGTALVVLGTLVNFFAAVQHVRFLRRLPSRELSRLRSSWFELSLSLLLAILGLAMAWYLLRLGAAEGLVDAKPLGKPLR